VYTYDEVFQSSKEYFDGEELSAKVFADKYALRDNDGNILELTPADMHRRIAKELARVEKNKFKKPMAEEEIFGYIDNFKYIVPQGSPMSAIGNSYSYQTLANCYVLDPPEDSYGSILATDEQLIQISKRRGGVGIDISKLRPRGTPTSNSARTSTGAVTFAERYSNSIREVGQHGRRGALLVSLSVHHPDISEFINVKRDLTKVTGANISVRLTDEFLNAVKNNTTYEQRWPIEDGDNASIKKVVDAKTVWMEIIENAHAMAEPGLLFWDNVLRESPANCYVQFGFGDVGCNPCCFSVDSDVQVITKKGIKNIQDIRAGDLIWIDEIQSWDFASDYFTVGEQEIYKIVLCNNETFEVTPNHKWVTPKRKRVGTKVKTVGQEFKETQYLKAGDLISCHINEVNGYEFGELGDYDLGLVLGWLAGDGCLSYHKDTDNYPACILDFWEKEHDTADIIQQSLSNLRFVKNFTEEYEYNIWDFRSKTKPIEFLNNCSKEFICAFIAAYFAADGTVQCEHSIKYYGLSLSSVNKTRLKQIKNILLLFGIKSQVCLLHEKRKTEIKGGIYDCNAVYRLVISGIDNIRKFHNSFTIPNSHKQKT